MRVWSVDWMQHRQRVLDAIVKAIEVPAKEQPTDDGPLNLTAPKIVAEKPVQAKQAALVSGTGDSKRDISDIKPAELDAAILHVVSQQVALPYEALLRAATRQLGYGRRTPRIDTALTRRIASLIVEKKILRDGDNIKAL